MTSLEAWRRETEAREWLKRTDAEPQKIKELLKRIAQKRGKDAAEVLRQDMRIAYQAARQGAATADIIAARDAGNG